MVSGVVEVLGGRWGGVKTKVYEVWVCVCVCVCVCVRVCVYVCAYACMCMHVQCAYLG